MFGSNRGSAREMFDLPNSTAAAAHRASVPIAGAVGGSRPEVSMDSTPLPVAPGLTTPIQPLNPMLVPAEGKPSGWILPPRTPSGYTAWANWARGIGIILVVFGHTWRGTSPLTRSTAPGPLQLLDATIYGVHMPLFFFLSGLFIERSARHSVGSFLVKKLKTVIYPYFLWTMLQGGLACLLRSYTNSNKQAVFSNILRESLYKPYAQFWFLYVLGVCMSLFMVLYKLRLKPVAIFVVAMAFCTFGFLRISLGSWGIVYQVQWNFVYFTAGAAIGPLLIAQLPQSRPGFLMFAAVAGIGLAFGTTYRGWHVSPGPAMLLALSGITGCLSLAAALAQARKLPVLEYLGKQSLAIFLAHVIFAAGMRTLLARMPLQHLPANVNLGIGLLLCTAAGIAMPLALSALADRFRIKGLFVLP